MINICTIESCLAIESSLLGRMQLMIHRDCLLCEASRKRIMSRIPKWQN